MEEFDREGYLRRDKDAFERRLVEREPMTVRFGNNLKALRRANGETLEHLARVFSLNKTTLSSFELGMTMPSLKTLKRFACYYDVTVDALTHSESSELAKLLKKRRIPNPILRSLKDILDLGQ